MGELGTYSQYLRSCSQSRPLTPVCSTFLPEADPFPNETELLSKTHLSTIFVPPPPDSDTSSEESDNPGLPIASHPSPSTSAAVLTPEFDDIRTEFHPNSGRPPKVVHFADYGREQESAQRTFRRPKKPWRPFRTRLDFEVAELILDTAMNAKQTTTLISLLQRCALGIEKFTIRSHDDLQKTWTQSSIKSVAVSENSLWRVLILKFSYTKFEKHDLPIPYKTGTRSYESYHRPLWDWALGHVDHPQLIREFVWDAERISKYNGMRWVRLFHEPWTCNRWWDIQVCYGAVR